MPELGLPALRTILLSASKRRFPATRHQPWVVFSRELPLNGREGPAPSGPPEPADPTERVPPGENNTELNTTQPCNGETTTHLTPSTFSKQRHRDGNRMSGARRRRADGNLRV